MKKLAYYFFKYWIKAGLFFYYRKLHLVGLENIPRNKPVLFLSNHQNALLDILPIATDSYRKPWYLTRGDIFRNRLFRPLFEFLQMIPIYRIRDGRKNLSKNQIVFEKCGGLLNNGEAILLFPEGNHSLKRRVRPISKGFTRIIDEAMGVNPNLDLKIVPIGQNYQNPKSAGDSRSIYFGAPIDIKDIWQEPDSIDTLKYRVFESLTHLTTHIDSEVQYDEVLANLQKANIDFTNPKVVNQLLGKEEFSSSKADGKSIGKSASRMLFRLLNLPIIVLWRLLVKPKVPEPEFEATFRFVFSMVVYTLTYSAGLFLLSTVFDLKTACFVVVGHAALNLALVKIGIT